jgi:hypothetical protein
MRSRMLLALPVLLAGWLLVVVSPAAAFKVYGPAWRSDAITYYNTVPAYDAYVKRGVQVWNASGMNARFVRSSSASKADVRVDFLPGPKRDALPAGVVGYTNLTVLNGRAFVAATVSLTRLTAVGLKRDGRTFQLVVIHELGHSLGLDHEQGTCALMNARVRPFTGPEKCGTAPSGKRYCRTLELDDERGAVKLYGGAPTPVSAPRFC